METGNGPVSKSEELLPTRPLVAPSVAQLITSAVPPYLITDVNHAWVELCRYTAAEVVGRTCKFLQGPETAQTADALKHLQRAIADRQHITVRILNRKKGGDVFLNELTVDALHDELGDLAGFRGCLVPVDMRLLNSQRRHTEARATDRSPILSPGGAASRPEPLGVQLPLSHHEAAIVSSEKRGVEGDEEEGDGEGCGKKGPYSVPASELFSRDAFPLQTLHSHPISPVLLRMLQLNNVSSLDSRAMLSQLMMGQLNGTASTLNCNGSVLSGGMCADDPSSAAIAPQNAAPTLVMMRGALTTTPMALTVPAAHAAPALAAARTAHTAHVPSLALPLSSPLGPSLPPAPPLLSGSLQQAAQNAAQHAFAAYYSSSQDCTAPPPLPPTNSTARTSGAACIRMLHQHQRHREGSPTPPALESPDLGLPHSLQPPPSHHNHPPPLGWPAMRDTCDAPAPPLAHTVQPASEPQHPTDHAALPEPAPGLDQMTNTPGNEVTLIPGRLRPCAALTATQSTPQPETPLVAPLAMALPPLLL